MSALATVFAKSFNGKLYSKNSDRVFYDTIADTNIERLKSLHTLLEKYVDNMLVNFEQSRMVRTT